LILYQSLQQVILPALPGTINFINETHFAPPNQVKADKNAGIREWLLKQWANVHRLKHDGIPIFDLPVIVQYQVD
jgi:hypothetical protein